VKRVLVAACFLLLLVLAGCLEPQKPRITAFSVAPREVVSGERVSIEAAAFAPAGIAHFEVRLGAGGPVIRAYCSGTKNCSKKIEATVDGGSGELAVELTVVDIHGNTANAKKSLIVAGTGGEACGNGVCGKGETPENCSADCGNETITRGFFGVDGVDNIEAWQRGILTLRDIENAATLAAELGVGLVGVNKGHWKAVEPEPPVNGKHTYDWSYYDKVFKIYHDLGIGVQLIVLSTSDWATVATRYPCSCCCMSPVREDCRETNPEFGMGCMDAWMDFVGGFVERFDGDGYNDAFEMSHGLIKIIDIGNEIEAPSHWQMQGGTPQSYWKLLQAASQAIKGADPTVLVARAASNAGAGFDDQPDEETLASRMARTSFDDFIIAFLELDNSAYDLFGIQCNDYYTGISSFSDWVRARMTEHNATKPTYCQDAKTTLYVRSQSPIPPHYRDDNENQIEDIIEELAAGNKEAKKAYWADQARQTVRKVVVALASGQKAVFPQFFWDFYPSGINQNRPLEASWKFTGLIETAHYMKSGRSIDAARASLKPAYFAYKQLIEKVVGANARIETLSLGDNVFAYRFVKKGKPFIIMWHEDIFDTVGGIVKRNQEKTVDVRNAIGAPNARVTEIITEVDENGVPVQPKPKVLPAKEVRINETPVFAEAA
jgi:hypothetical protein